jgi:hypothetical protein
MLCEAFETVCPVYFGATVWRDDYEELRRRFVSLPEDPYYFLLDRCLHRLIQGLFEHPKDEGVAIYCDQDKDRKIVMGLGLWHENYIRSNPTLGHLEDSQREVTLTYGSNVQYIPLQAVDVIAHELMRFGRANRNMRGVANTNDPDAWILDRLKRQRGSLWFPQFLLKDQLEMELDGRAWVPHGAPSYRFFSSSGGQLS